MNDAEMADFGRAALGSDALGSPGVGEPPTGDVDRRLAGALPVAGVPVGGVPVGGALPQDAVAAQDPAGWMGQALVEAGLALRTGDVPVGAVVVDASGAVIGRGRNAREARQDPTAHAELLALRSAATALGTWRLTGCTLVVTLEPCAMCAGALVLARVARLVLGAWDPKAGAAGSMRDIVRDARLNHRVEVLGGVRAEESAALLRTFFTDHRRPASDHHEP